MPPIRPSFAPPVSRPRHVRETRPPDRVNPFWTRTGSTCFWERLRLSVWINTQPRHHLFGTGRFYTRILGSMAVECPDSQANCLHQFGWLNPVPRSVWADLNQLPAQSNDPSVLQRAPPEDLKHRTDGPNLISTATPLVHVGHEHCIMR